jgi:hypothetical protein
MCHLTFVQNTAIAIGCQVHTSLAEKSKHDFTGNANGKMAHLKLLLWHMSKWTWWKKWHREQ